MFAPALGIATELADRQRIKKLVGDQIQRGLGQGADIIVPCGTGHCFGLPLAQAW